MEVIGRQQNKNLLQEVLKGMVGMRKTYSGMFSKGSQVRKGNGQGGEEQAREMERVENKRLITQGVVSSLVWPSPGLITPGCSTLLSHSVCIYSTSLLSVLDKCARSTNTIQAGQGNE